MAPLGGASPSSPGGTCIAIHNESLGARLVVGNVTGTNAGGVTGANLVYASALNDFTNWKLAGQAGADPNFPADAITVGDNWPVTGLFSQRAHLSVAKQQSWWVITGGLNAFTARPAARTTDRWMQTPQAGGMDDDQNIWFVPYFDDIPAVFDGSKFGETRTLHFNAFNYSQDALPPPFSVHRNLRHNEVFLAAVTAPLGPMLAALHQEDLWTFHRFTVPAGFNGCWTVPGDGGMIYLSDGGTVGAAPKFYAWATHLDTRVPLSTNPTTELNTDAGGAYTATVILPEYWGRTGEVFGVRGVLVDLKRWNTGFAAHNHYDLAVTGLRQYTDPAATPFAQPVTKTATFDEVTSAVPGGVGASQTIRLLHLLEFEEANGFQVTFNNVRGLEIQKVQVVLNVLSPLPRGI